MSKLSPRDRLVSRQGQIPVTTAPAVDPAQQAAASLGARLTKAQYQALEAMFPPRLTAEPTLAAQYLGQQQVLQAIRNQFVN